MNNVPSDNINNNAVQYQYQSFNNSNNNKNVTFKVNRNYSNYIDNNEFTKNPYLNFKQKTEN